MPVKLLSASAMDPTPVLLEPPDPRENRDPMVNLALMELTDPPVRQEAHHQWLLLLMEVAVFAHKDLRDHPVQLDPQALVDPQEVSAPLANLDNPANPDLLVPQAHQVVPVLTVKPDQKDPQVPPVPEVEKVNPDPKVHQGKMVLPDQMEPQVPQEPQANPVKMVPLAHPDPQVQVEPPAVLVPLEHRDPLDPMPNIARAPNVLVAPLLPRSKPLEVEKQLHHSYSCITFTYITPCEFLSTNLSQNAKSIVLFFTTLFISVSRLKHL